MTFSHGHLLDATSTLTRYYSKFSHRTWCSLVSWISKTLSGLVLAVQSSRCVGCLVHPLCPSLETCPWCLSMARNFANELLQPYVLRHTFKNNVSYNRAIQGDGIALPSIATMDSGACIELLWHIQLSEQSQCKSGDVLGIVNEAFSVYKSGKSDDCGHEDMQQELFSKYSIHASFIPNPSSSSINCTIFGINQYSGSVSYHLFSFIIKDSDLVNSAFVSLLHTSSSEPFVTKLLSGLSLAEEKHYKDEHIIVQAKSPLCH